MEDNNDTTIYETQGFGADIQLKAPFGLLIVDLVNGFADPAVFGGGNIGQAIDKTVPLLAAARHAGWPIAHTRIVYAEDGSDHNVFSAKIPSMLTLTEQAHASQIVSELTPREGELVVRKNVASAFFGTSLAAWLTHRGVHTLLVAGAVTSGCIRASVVDASQLGFVPLVIEDCVGDRAQGPHQANLFDMQQKYAAVMKRDEALAKLGIEVP
ncbi:N-carbamoylsarcosine amidase [Advenella sp. S44]|uniref:N-carbamoylsarcosine amidohydrolase n=1 Tax=Advenella sp. S44 TaxID=1982755 RepID=UPI000C2B1490|nr:N-carbamoylsarcosine amidohydrolase [Advenella sp. S44]PJX28099.1 N-carbamoylsarcosine amidase [Advenella sp. S44]